MGQILICILTNNCISVWNVCSFFNYFFNAYYFKSSNSTPGEFWYILQFSEDSSSEMVFQNGSKGGRRLLREMIHNLSVKEKINHRLFLFIFFSQFIFNRISFTEKNHISNIFRVSFL